MMGLSLPGRIGASLGGLVLLFSAIAFVNNEPSPQEAPGPFGRAWDFSIQEGDIWAGPLWKRASFWGSPTDRRDWDFRVRYDLSAAPDGMAFKIIGLSDLSTRMNRVKLYGWGQAPSMTHEDSDRFVGSVGYDGETRGVWVSAYAYRSGYGGISGSMDVAIPDSVGPLSRRLGFIPDTSWAVLSLKRGPTAADYWFHLESWEPDSSVHVSIPLTHQPSVLQERWSGFSHAGSGASQPRAPGTLRFEMAKR